MYQQNKKTLKNTHLDAIFPGNAHPSTEYKNDGRPALVSGHWSGCAGPSLRSSLGLGIFQRKMHRFHDISVIFPWCFGWNQQYQKCLELGITMW